MKRVVSLLLAAVLILAPCMQSFATEDSDAPAGDSSIAGDSKPAGTPNTPGADGSGTEPADAENGGGVGTAPTVNALPPEDMETMSEDQTEEQDDTDLIQDKGQVDVHIMQALDLKQEITFTVSIAGQAKSITLDPTGTQEAGVTFDNLPEGDYDLIISAPGFASHTQNIKVDGKASKLTFATRQLGGIDYTGNHPGILLIGDVREDGKVDDVDKDLLITCIDEKNDSADLNRDGNTDLLDLECFVQGYKVDEKFRYSTIEKNVPASVITHTLGEGTKAEGNLENLSKGEGSVILKPANGGSIKDNPVSVEFDFLETEEAVTDGIIIDSSEENPIETGQVDIIYMEDGEEKQCIVPITQNGIETLLIAENVSVEKDDYGNIRINLGSQIAVKKVTLTITGMKKNNNLAEISRVEFVNGMENRIPEPERDIPEGLTAAAGNKTFTLSWDPCRNITGYEVQIEDAETGDNETVPARGTALTVTSFNGDKLENGKDYFVRVQSVNGTWRSGYCEKITVTPKVDKVPDRPDGVSAVGKYKAIDVSWKKVKDTDSYNVYYRKSGDQEYTKVEGITLTSYTISDLEDQTAYEIYVTAVNEIGESSKSEDVKAETINQDPAKMPRYKLLNPAEEGMVSEHIISAATIDGTMQDSPLDEEQGTAWGTVDNNSLSYYSMGSWDGGGYNPLGNHGLFFEFDQPYKMDRLALQEVTPQGVAYGYIQGKYWDAEGNEHVIARQGIQRKTDSENRVYYVIRFPQVIEAKKIQIGLARSVASGTITVSEVYFYHYDSIEDDIMALYEDDLHTVLRSDVTQETINALKLRINTKDPESGEYHPDKEYLERELQTAQDILDSKLTKSVQVHNTITTQDVGRGFGGLNAWQPLGVTAAAGEEITVYVGHNTKRTGDSTNLQLVSTQYHSESGSMFRVVATLKIGRNDITVPKLWSLDKEAGGALYVQYTGNNANDNYAVRVSGGVQVPILDLYQVSDPAERLSRAQQYVTELESYVGEIEAKHDEVHKNSENSSVDYDYKAQDCILGASDIMLDTMMLSLPAQQILAGLGNGDKAQKLVTSMDAMENMMYLFYQHKGLNNSAPEVKDRFPANHLNIRYQTMFAGAFMYASGNHIGIEWGSAPGMMNGVTVQADESGRYQSGQYYGWGIAHEIGHCINQGTYAIAEITNNYFSVLAQARDTNDSVRFQYENVYDKVTSGAKGRASNVFTQLGMYWQLHLAYDNGLNYKTYADYEKQLANLFFARVDTYARTPGRAPVPAETALALSGDVDQDLMRLSCAAAEKNILDFFVRWGMTPDEDTIKYAEQFPVETRAIYYVNDDSRVYRLGTDSKLGTEGNVEAVGDGTTAVVDPDAANKVNFTLTSTLDPEEILGYEIVRCITSNGDVEREVAGFTTKSTFTDTITTMNNRVVTYEVTVIDKHLNRSAVKTLESVKINHKGNIDKSHWSITTKDIAATNVEDAGEGDENTPCGPEVEAPIMKAFDNDSTTTYTGEAGENAEIVMELNQTTTVSGFQYTVNSGTPIEGYTISIRNDQNEWIEAASGTFKNDKVNTVYFNDKAGSTVRVLYQTDAVKLSINGMQDKEIAISELDVLGVTGDNVEFRYTDNGQTATIGELETAYKYGDRDEDVIPAGSIVFVGTYAGNSAYNVVILYDQDGNIVGGENDAGELKAEQVLFSDVPEEGNIEDTYDGTWIYWINPEDAAGLTMPQKVRAELYRVDDALTNQGQRLVSDSVFETVPASLPKIQLSDHIQ